MLWFLTVSHHILNNATTNDLLRYQAVSASGVSLVEKLLFFLLILTEEYM